jgi:hypothetical protein
VKWRCPTYETLDSRNVSRCVADVDRASRTVVEREWVYNRKEYQPSQLKRK